MSQDDDSARVAADGADRGDATMTTQNSTPPDWFTNVDGPAVLDTDTGSTFVKIDGSIEYVDRERARQLRDCLQDVLDDHRSSATLSNEEPTDD